MPRSLWSLKPVTSHAITNRTRRLREHPEAQSIESVVALCERLTAIAPDLPAVVELVRAVTAWATDRRNRRCVDNQGLVGKQVNDHFFHALEAAGIPQDDAKQVGYMAVLHAAELFGEARGFEFSTYAVRWIRQAISRLLTCDNTIHVPDHLIHRKKGLSARGKKYQEHARKIRRVLSLDVPLAGKGGGGSESLADHTIDPKTLREAEEAGCRVDVAAILRCLSQLDATVLRLRFLGGLTMREVAAELFRRGLKDEVISRERVRQIEEQALENVRARTGGRLPGRARRRVKQEARRKVKRQKAKGRKTA